MKMKKITLAVAGCSALSMCAQAAPLQKETLSDTVTVTANRFSQPISTVIAPVDVITRHDIVRWQAKSLPEIMARLPGVDSVQNGGAGQQSALFIRGTNSSHVLILMDGIRLNQAGISSSYDISQIPISLIQRIEYIRGARSAVYGSDAIGGVINIITQPDADEIRLSAGTGSNGYQNYDAAVTQSFGDTTVSLAGNYSYTKGYDVVANLPDSYGTPAQPDRDGFMSKTLFGSVQQRFNDSFTGFFRGYGYDNRTAYDGYYNYYDPSDYSAAALVDTRKLYSQTWDAGLRFQNDLYSSQLVASYSHSKDYNYSPSLGKYHASSTLDDIQQYNLQWGNTLHVGKGTLSAGVDWQKQTTEPGTNYLDNGYEQRNTGLYLTGQQLLGPVIVEASVRGDDHSEFGWHTTWQGALSWEFIEGYRIVASYGTAYKAPNLGQLYSPYYGNTSLQPEESKQWEGGVEGITGPVSWRVSAYRNDIENLINSDPVTYRNYNIDEARIKGAEISASFETGFLGHHLSYDYVDPRDGKTNEILLRRAKQQFKYELSTQLYDVEWSLFYRYLGQRYDKNFNRYPTETIKYGGVSLWDIAVAYPVTPQFSVHGRIANLTDKKYETVYGYRTPEREYYLTVNYVF